MSASLVSIYVVKNLHAVREAQFCSLGLEDPLEKGMAIHSTILTWKIPWTEDSGRLQSMGLQGVRQLSECFSYTDTHTPARLRGSL